MKKKALYVFFASIVLLFTSTICFAANETKSTDLGNEIKDSINTTERSAENLVDDAAGTAREGENAVTGTDNNRDSRDNTDRNDNTDTRNSVSGTTSNVTAGTTVDTTTDGGMNTTTWMWIIAAVIAVIIIAAVWYYAAQGNN